MRGVAVGFILKASTKSYLDGSFLSSNENDLIDQKSGGRTKGAWVKFETP